MYKFDVRYTQENYFEYYKNVLISQKIWKNLIFTLIFFAIGIWWLVDTKQTDGYGIAIFAFVMGIIMPCSNFLFLPLLKKQLKGKQADIDATHIEISFNEDEIIYENKTIIQTPSDIKPEVEDKVEADINTTDDLHDTQEVVEDEKPEKEEKVFTLHYNNFFEVRQSANLIMMSLDRQTIIILPKETIVSGDIEGFIRFLSTKIDARRFKIKLPKASDVE